MVPRIIQLFSCFGNTSQLPTCCKDYTWYQYQELKYFDQCSKILQPLELVSPWKGQRNNSVFRSLRRLERSSPTSPAPFGLLCLQLFRFTIYSWHLLRGSFDCAENAYGPAESFISKSYVSCTECPSVNKIISLSNVFVTFWYMD